MGVFHQRIEVAGLDAQRFEAVEAIVDTGASFTMLPGSFLASLGVSPHDRARFRIADGNLVEAELGRVWIRVNGRTEPTLVAFGDERAPAVLGALTLGALRLTVDPLGVRLVDRELYLVAAGYSVSRYIARED